MNRQLKDGYGVVYLFSNDLLEKEQTFKYGITIHPYQRKRIQSNTTPPTHPFYNIIVLFSPHYKAIEKRLKEEFSAKDFLLDKGDGGKEWIKGDLSVIVDIYKKMVSDYPSTIMCYQGKGYRNNNGMIEEGKIPDCRLDLLGILDDAVITCIKDNKSFTVKDNMLLIDDQTISLSAYMKTNYKRNGVTNEYNGYQYFKYKNMLIYDLWQSLVKGKEPQSLHE